MSTTSLVHRTLGAQRRGVRLRALAIGRATLAALLAGFDGAPRASRGLRGGAYTSTPPYLRSAYRMGDSPDRFHANGDFDCGSSVLTPERRAAAA